MRYYVCGKDITDPEVHLWDVYIGEQVPSLSDEVGLTVKEFYSKPDLQRFLSHQKIDQLSIYTAPDCPGELVSDLVQWADLNLSLHNEIIVCENQDVP